MSELGRNVDGSGELSVRELSVCALSYGELFVGGLLATGSLVASLAVVVAGASGAPPFDDSRFIPVARPLVAVAIAGDELGSPASSRRDEAGSTRGEPAAALAPAPVIGFDEGGSHAPFAVGRLLLDGTT